MRKGLAKLLPAILARMCNNHFFIPCANPTPFCTKLKMLPQNKLCERNATFLEKTLAK